MRLRSLGELGYMGAAAPADPLAAILGAVSNIAVGITPAIVGAAGGNAQQTADLLSHLSNGTQYQTQVNPPASLQTAVAPTQTAASGGALSFLSTPGGLAVAAIGAFAAWKLLKGRRR